MILNARLLMLILFIINSSFFPVNTEYTVQYTQLEIRDINVY